MSALLRERQDRRACSETLSEVAQFRRDFRVFYSERHRCGLDLKPGYRNSNVYRLNTVDQLASSQQNQISDSEEQWDMVVVVDDEDVTFLERVWTLYCDYYDNDETVGIDDGRWRPHRDGIIEWQRGHRALIDPSRAEQIYDSITTRYPREPIGLIFTVFRDELAGRDDLKTPYVSRVRRG